MAYYSIFPEKTSTIYSHPDRLELNTGNDEIIELIKEKGNSGSDYYPSRVLIQFKDEDINKAYNIFKLNPNYIDNSTEASLVLPAFLELFSTEHQNLGQLQELEIFPLSQSWNAGTGKYSDKPQTSNGCTWKYSDNSIRTTNWSTEFNNYSTGSIESEIIKAGGGTWHTSIPDRFSNILYTQSFNNVDILDINVDIKNQAYHWSNGTIENNGLIIKYNNNIETYTPSSVGNLQFFSVNTHTIYPPKLTFKWDDSVHSSQSIAKTNGELNVSLYRNKKEYNQNDEALIRLHVRDKYPTRQFTSSSNYLNPGYFTTSSFYSIRDAHTEEEIIPFDNDYTKLSADDEGMYFKLYIIGLQPERYYRILFKHINNDGTEIYDNNYHFKVVR